MTGKRIGYVRVSTVDQNPDRQLDGVELDKKYIEYASGSSLKRPQLDAMMDYIREDDCVIVHSLDRLARNLKDLLELIEIFEKKKVEVRFVKENLNFNGKDSSFSKMILGILGTIYEFEREKILERQREGIEQAKRQGKYKGKQNKLTSSLIEKIKEHLQTRKTKTKIAQELAISRYSLYRYIKQIEKQEFKKNG